MPRMPVATKAPKVVRPTLVRELVSGPAHVSGNEPRET